MKLAITLVKAQLLWDIAIPIAILRLIARGERWVVTMIIGRAVAFGVGWAVAWGLTKALGSTVVSPVPGILFSLGFMYGLHFGRSMLRFYRDYVIAKARGYADILDRGGIQQIAVRDAREELR